MLGLAKKNKAKILQASTSEIYGDPDVHPQTEKYNGNVNPLGYRSCYDEGKRCSETLFMDYYREHKLKIKIVILKKQTQCQPETIVKTIISEKIKGPIFIKDSDNFFHSKINGINEVCIFDLNKMNLVHSKNKSFVKFNNNNIITNIVEKRVISSNFCVGGYGFECAQSFVNTFNELNNDSDLYVSHIIFKQISDDKIFSRGYNWYESQFNINHNHLISGEVDPSVTISILNLSLVEPPSATAVSSIVKLTLFTGINTASI